MKIIVNYLFAVRYIVIPLLMMVGINYLLSEPTRIIVNSVLFIAVVYLISLFSWIYLKRLSHLYDWLILLWFTVAYVYLELVQFRYNGAVDSSYDTLYWLFSTLLTGQGLLWIFSLYPFNLYLTNHRQEL